MRKIHYLKLMLIFMCAFVANRSTAQTTGSYDINITFNAAPRQLSFYVPPTYVATQRYRLIVALHGLGDNSVNYRNALVGPLAWPASMPNTIIVCPEAFNTNTDFYLPAGSDSIIQACINYAEANYHIDTANIILQGFSLGGRAALRYGLDHYADFKGLLLNTPAVQGVKQALNQNSIYTFNYANASHIPIYITHGGTDITYESPIDSTYEQLVLNDGKVRYFQFPTLGHTIPPTAQIINFLPFFDTPSAAGYDLDIVKPVIAQRTCATTIPATTLIRNTGTNVIHSAIINYNTGGGPLSYTWTGALAPFQHAIVTLPTIAAAAGVHTLTVGVTSLDGGIADTITGNNQKSVPFQVVTSGLSLPYFQGFEGVNPPADWVQYLAGDFYTPWLADSTVHKTGIASINTFNTILIFDNTGRHDDFVSPVLNLASSTNPHMTFDVAYNYHKYTAAVLGVDSIFADTLEVLISTDCGDNYTRLYKKGGSQLATFANPILNPLSVDADFADPADTNWRMEYIDLTPYATADKATVMFRYTSALGGSLNIDNINFTNVPVGVQTVSHAKYTLYPDPANDVVNINTGDDKLERVVVMDMTGKTMVALDNTGKGNTATINTSTFADGVYVFQLFAEHDVKTKKVVIKH